MDEVLYGHCHFTESETTSEAEERIRAEILSLTQRRDAVESEVDQSVPQVFQTYDRLIEATAGEAPDFEGARALITELQRLEEALSERLRAHRRLGEEIYDHRRCLSRLFEDDSEMLNDLLVETLGRIGTHCFRNGDADAAARRLLENAIERFNGLPGHGEDFDADGPSCPLPPEGAGAIDNN